MRRGGQLSPTAREIYQRQALLYAWMLRQLSGGAEVRAELVLIEIGGDEVEREPLEVDFDLLEAAVRRRLNSLIRAFEAENAAICLERRAAGERLRFPYRDTRPGQEQIVEAVDGRARATASTCCSRRPPASARRWRRSTRRCATRWPNDKRALRPHRQDPAAGDGDRRARACSITTARFRAATAARQGRRCAPTTRSSATRSTAASPRTTSSSSTPPAWCAACSETRIRPWSPTPSSGRQQAEVCPFEVSLELAASRPGRGLRLQLRLRSLRRAHRLRRPRTTSPTSSW